MSFGLFWLSSIILSDFMFIVTIFRAMKDLVDEGYKLTGSNLNKNSNSTDNNSLPMFLILLIPIANILAMLSFSSLVINNKEILFDVFKSRNMIKEMTKEEIEEYEKNPTLINAFKTCMKKEKINKEELVFKLSFESISGQIEYTLENNEVKIISSTLDSNKYDLKTQKNLVSATIKLVYERLLKNFESKEELNKYTLSTPDKILNKIEDYKVIKEDENIIKRYYLEYELLDKYKEAIKNRNELETLSEELDESEEITSEKLELINKLKSKYKELILEAAKISNDLSNPDEDENQKVSEEKMLKK